MEMCETCVLIYGDVVECCYYDTIGKREKVSNMQNLERKYDIYL